MVAAVPVRLKGRVSIGIRNEALCYAEQSHRHPPIRAPQPSSEAVLQR